MTLVLPFISLEVLAQSQDWVEMPYEHVTFKCVEYENGYYIINNVKEYRNFFSNSSESLPCSPKYPDIDFSKYTLILIQISDGGGALNDRLIVEKNQTLDKVRVEYNVESSGNLRMLIFKRAEFLIQKSETNSIEVLINKTKKEG